MRLVLRGGRLLDPVIRKDTVGDVLIVDGTLAIVGPKADATGAKVESIPGATQSSYSFTAEALRTAIT